MNTLDMKASVRLGAVFGLVTMLAACASHPHNHGIYASHDALTYDERYLGLAPVEALPAHPCPELLELNAWYNLIPGPGDDRSIVVSGHTANMFGVGLVKHSDVGGLLLLEVVEDPNNHSPEIYFSDHAVPGQYGAVRIECQGINLAETAQINHTY